MQTDTYIPDTNKRSPHTLLKLYFYFSHTTMKAGRAASWLGGGGGVLFICKETCVKRTVAHTDED